MPLPASSAQPNAQPRALTTVLEIALCSTLFTPLTGLVDWEFLS